MKPIIRGFFRLVHAIVGPLLLLADRLTAPRGIRRDPTAQRLVDAQTKDLVLYQFLACPFCIRTRRTIRRLALDIETRDALHHRPSRRQLLKCGGKIQVPCLRIRRSGDRMQWLYESDEIIRYLEERFAAGGP
jgi:glutaredoxin